MNFCSIGVNLQINSIDFLSNNSILDYDVVFWNMDDSYRVLMTYGEERGDQFVIEKDKFTSLMKKLNFRKNEFKEFLELERVIFIFTPNKCKVKFNVVDENGQGKIISVNLYDLMEMEPLKVSSRSGSNVSVASNKILQYWSGLKIFNYHNTIEPNQGIPLMYINKTDHIVSSYLPRERGKVIFIPEMKVHSNILNTFINSTRQIVDDLPSGGNEEIQFPKWTEEYFLLDEKEQLNKTQEISEEVIKLNKVLESEIENLKNLRKLKLLFWGDGKNLENIVKEVFEDVGFEVTIPDNNRDDLIIKTQKKVAVVEVKGVKGSSGEKHATQLEKWRMIYNDNNNVIPKGILIVNTFCSTSIQERKDEDFPNQMLSFSEVRGHCLITGINFLNLYLNLKSNNIDINEFSSYIFNTIGVFKRGKKIKNLIQFIK